MVLSELIEKLKKIQGEHGDIRVRSLDEYGLVVQVTNYGVVIIN